MFDVEVILTVVSLIGMALVSRHEYRFMGFGICSVSNVGWIALGIMIQHTPYILLFGGYLIFNTIGMHDEYSTWLSIRDMKRKYKNKYNIK